MVYFTYIVRTKQKIIKNIFEGWLEYNVKRNVPRRGDKGIGKSGN